LKEFQSYELEIDEEIESILKETQSEFQLFLFSAISDFTFLCNCESQGAVWRVGCILRISCGPPQNPRYSQDTVSRFQRYWQNQKLVFGRPNISFFFEILFARLLPISTNPRYSKFAVSQSQIVSGFWPQTTDGLITPLAHHSPPTHHSPLTVTHLPDDQ
jgi:hypothetical protein